MIGRRKPQADLTETLAEFSAALELAEGRLPDETVNLGRLIVDKADGRLRHGTDHTLVSFLGATGGGKSSLTNAIAGSDIATTGIRRPTTSTTLALYWGDADPQPLLDWLEVPNRHQVHGDPDLHGLVLLDVPDHDSVELANRAEMERIAEHADLMVWVTDPEKYGDAAMHQYLRRLGHHGAVTAMVLNKVDQLSNSEIETCRRDLAALLGADGLGDAPIISTSAISATGIDELNALLAKAVTDRQAMIERLRADVGSTASALLADLGPADGGGKIASSTRKTLIAELTEASGLAIVCDAVDAGHRRDASAATGWPFTRWIRSLRPHPLRRLHLDSGSGGRASLPKPSGAQQARTEGAVRSAVGTVTEKLPEPWPDLIRTAATPDTAVLNDRLDQAVATSVRANDGSRPRWWRAVNVLQLVLAAAVVVGAVWLALLAFAAYLQIPELPTPTYRRVPIPTGLLIGGIALGLLLAFIARRLAVLGAKRRSRAVRKEAADAVGDVANELVLEPMTAELDRRDRLRTRLVAAGGTG